MLASSGLVLEERPPVQAQEGVKWGSIWIHLGCDGRL